MNPPVLLVNGVPEVFSVWFGVDDDAHHVAPALAYVSDEQGRQARVLDPQADQQRAARGHRQRGRQADRIGVDGSAFGDCHRRLAAERERDRGLAGGRAGSEGAIDAAPICSGPVPSAARKPGSDGWMRTWLPGRAADCRGHLLAERLVAPGDLRWRRECVLDRGLGGAGPRLPGRRRDGCAVSLGGLGGGVADGTCGAVQRGRPRPSPKAWRRRPWRRCRVTSPIPRCSWRRGAPRRRRSSASPPCAPLLLTLSAVAMALKVSRAGGPFPAPSGHS